MHLYFLEGEEGFENLPLRTMVSKISRYGDGDFCEWLFEKGSSGELPNNWDDMKICIIQYCTSSGLEDARMYRDEPFSEYLLRLKDIANRCKQNEDAIFRKLRSERKPEKYKGFIYSCDFGIDKIIERIKSWEFSSKYENDIPKRKYEKFLGSD
jgi:hypothetical protein